MSAVSRVSARSRLAVWRARPGAFGARAPDTTRLGGPVLLLAFSLAAVGAGTARALTTTYLPVLLERIDDAPTLIGAVMTVNALAGLVVPLAVGTWSDRRRASGLGRRLPFMVGGTSVAAAGLLAVALGSGSSYLALGLAAAVVYTGLNALTTLHRALVVDDVGDDRRPAVTSAQEVAATGGAGIAVGLGAALIEPSPGLAFVLGAAVLVAASVPTLIVVRRLNLGHAAPAARTGWRESVGGALRLPGAREVLLAQALWVFAYAALPTFFVLYARDELGIGVGIGGALSLAFGLAIAVAMVLAGRARAERVHPLLLSGAALLGAGLVLAGLTGTVALASAGLAAAGAGAGVVTALGFPYFARFVPDGEAGAYSGAFFAGRGLASAVALPTAGLTVELTGTYRSVLWLGVGALLALAPLVAAGRRYPAVAVARPRPARVAAVMPVFASSRASEGFAVLRDAGSRFAGAMVAVLVIGAALPALQPLDNELFLAINSLGDGPEWVYQAFDPHGRNYVLLVLTTAVASAIVLRRARYAVGTAIAVVLAALLADAAWELVKLFIQRDRPEEVLGTQVARSHDRTWADIGSYPSGHLVVTAAMAATAAAAVRALRGPLLAYVGAIALTRLLFGAHFPIDVLVGAALGHEAGRFTATMLASARLIPQRPAAQAVALESQPALEMQR